MSYLVLAVMSPAYIYTYLASLWLGLNAFTRYPAGSTPSNKYQYPWFGIGIICQAGESVTGGGETGTGGGESVTGGGETCTGGGESGSGGGEIPTGGGDSRAAGRSNAIDFEPGGEGIADKPVAASDSVSNRSSLRRTPAVIETDMSYIT